MTERPTRRGVLSGLASTLALGATASTATAQENSTATASSTSTATESETDDLPTGAERIDGRTVLLSSEYDQDGGTATLTLLSTEPQGVTFSDAGAFVAGGQVATRTEVLDSGRNTITMPVTNADGYAGVSVSTANVLYAVPLTTTSTVSFSPSSPNDMLALALGAGLVGPGAVLAGWKIRERRRANGVTHVGR